MENQEWCCSLLCNLAKRVALNIYIRRLVANDCSEVTNYLVLDIIWVTNSPAEFDWVKRIGHIV
jgi:hypothetical protein